MNDALQSFTNILSIVLIDTWWNVNEYFGDTLQSPVLIDTWWNVNQNIVRDTKFPVRCFNRYMVECE